ncbi:MAG: hypothetical protein IT431_00950 [Phycisphaerales bacterium]|nr:hypothetical protein [Phycisphaerales bacterium]
MRPTTEPEHLSARWDAVNRRLAELSAARTGTPEGDAVGEEERALLEELDRIEGRLGDRAAVARTTPWNGTPVLPSDSDPRRTS